ncbi:hypothetical protein V492_00159 [Pseudogymnoascus sp. VKM F-4246]|nr:hypothetical protein V492_00159 [Pseudogymnoascus sp. VKM F-4246]
MSFGFSVGDFIAVIELAKRVRREFVDAPGQFKAISDEVRGLSIVLQDVEDRLSGPDLDEKQEEELRDITNSCCDVLNDLKKTLEKYSELKSGYSGVGSRAKRIWKGLKWEPNDIKELRSRIIVNITLWNAFQGKIDSQASAAIKVGVDLLNERQDTEERQKAYDAILDWITLVNYSPQHNDFINRRHAGTGKWLLESPEFKDWIETGKTLFCPGMPGAGKTILTSVVVDELKTRFQDDKSVGIAYLYCNFRRQHEQTAKDLLGSLLKQLIQRQGCIPDSVETLYDTHNLEYTRLPFDEIIGSLRSVATAIYSRVFIIVDALDECQISENGRTEFLEAIFTLQNECPTSINIFATSRLLPEIKEKFSDAIQREIYAHPEDVRKYLEGHIQGLPRCVRQSLDLQNEIKDKIATAVDGMFLLAKLYLDALKGKKSPKAIRKALDELPTGFQAFDETYDKAYDDAMERIRSQINDETELAMRVIYWITCAKTPLTTIQIELALAIERDSSEFDEDNICPVEDMVSVCAGLVTVDEESGIIRLVHYTTQQYFTRTEGKWFPDIEADMAAICCTYLSFDKFGSGTWLTDEELEQREEEDVLYSYAAHYWGLHAREAPMLLPEVTAFLEKQAQVEAASQTQLHESGPVIGTVRLEPQKLTGLHLASYFGLEEAVKFLIDRQDPDAKDSNGWTPLFYATENEHEAIVELLLATDGVNPSSTTGELVGLTPLHLAAGKGHERIVRMLLAQEGVNPEAKDPYHETVLCWAAKNGHLSIVKLLLDIDGVDPHSSSYGRGETPLSFAVRNGHLAVTEALLARLSQDGINSDIPHWSGDFTPLHIAAINGYEEILKLLLAHGTVNVNNVNTYSYTTPLIGATQEGHEAIVKLLLEHKDIIPDFRYLPNRHTALQIAASNRYEGIVRLLLAHKDVNPTVYGGGASPLSAATSKGYTEIVQMLLAHDSIKNSPD